MVRRTFLFILHAGSRRLGCNNLRNSSYKGKTACSTRVSSLSFRFLWLWFKFMFKWMTQDQTKSSHKFHPFRFMRVIHRTRGSSDELIVVCVFSKINRLLELRRLMFNLFHWMIVDEKNSFLKRSSLCKKGVSEWHFLCYVMNLLRKSNWRGIEDVDSLIFCKASKPFYTSTLAGRIQHLILNKLFFSMYP